MRSHRAKQAGGEPAGRSHLTDVLMVGPPHLAGQIRACFPSREALPACSGAAGLGQHGKAWCVAGNKVMLVSYFTLCAQGTGLKSATRQPSTGATRGRGQPGLPLPRTSGQTGELIGRQARWRATDFGTRPTSCSRAGRFVDVWLSLLHA